MTRNTAVCRTTRAAIVGGVVKFHIKTLVEFGGKCPQRRGRTLHIGMANRAHRRLRRNELRQMTIDAGGMSGKFRRNRIIRALVTRIAINTGVSAAAVQKSAVVLGIKQMRRKNI